MLNFSDIKLGKVVEFQNQPCVIIKCDFLRMQSNKPTKKCVLKSLTTGSNLIYTFKSGESVEEADVSKEEATFMYADDKNLTFMLSKNFETIELSASMLDDKVGYLKEGLEVSILYFNENAISIDLPLKVSFKIIQTMDVDKGNTVNNVLKEATIETGKVVRVPSFIKEGENVIINTVEDEYVERDKS